MGIKNFTTRRRKIASLLRSRAAILYWAVKDRRVPALVKILAFFIVAYALSPIDIIPDFIPLIGYLDDIIVIPLAVSFALSPVPLEVKKEYELRLESEEETIPQRIWQGIFIVVGIWLLFGLAIYKAFLD